VALGILHELGFGDIVIDAGGNVSFIDSGSIRS
jgi:hypothetical protein